VGGRRVGSEAYLGLGLVRDDDDDDFGYEVGEMEALS
jgi:hypothetical protein